jgi:hypothetical protein
MSRMRLFVHCAKPHGKFDIWEVSINYCNISLLEAKERCYGEMEDPWHSVCCVGDMKVCRGGGE